MDRERIDEEEFVLVTGDEFRKLIDAWTDCGGETDDVGDGVFLFLVKGSVQFRVRVGRPN